MQRYSVVPSASTQPTEPSADPKAEDSSVYKAEIPCAGWPSKPQTLREATPSWVYRLLPHIALFIIPMAAIFLGTAVIAFNGRAESQRGKVLKQAMAVTSTLWPILFAAVVGPTLKTTALYRAERGVKLGVLEILFLSQTLVSTLRGCFTLRIVSMWPMLLVLVWALSPAGGQGALRALNIRQNTTTYQHLLTSYPINNMSAFEDAVFASPYGQLSKLSKFRASIGAVFSGADSGLVQANKSSEYYEVAVDRIGGAYEASRMTKRDLWRNIRIPFLHSLPGYDKTKTDWTTVPTSMISEYSSLIGIPVRNFPTTSRGNTTFKLQTNYQTVECMPWRDRDKWLLSNAGSLVSNKTEGMNSSGLGFPNLVLDIQEDGGRWSNTPNPVNSSQFMVWNKHAEPFERLTLVVYTSTGSDLTLCQMSTEYVDAVIDCSRSTLSSDTLCSVQKMRHSPEFREKGNLTALDIWDTKTILKHIPYTMAGLASNGPSILENWLQDPTTAFQRKQGTEGFSLSGKLTPKIFSDRLAVVLNTFLRATFDLTITIGSDIEITERNPDRSSWATMTGTWTEFNDPIYCINMPWFIIYYISTIFLTLCAVTNVLLRCWIHTPDIFGSVAALTRDSLFLKTPTPASGMDSSERSRLLQDKWVVIQDVRPDGPIGRIAFSDDEGSTPLSKDRVYI